MRVKAYLHAALSCGILLVCASCTDDSFSQIVEIPIPAHDPQPVLSLELTAGDTLVYPLVTRSYGVLDEEPTEDRTTTYRLLRNGEPVFAGTGNIANVRRAGEAVTPDSIIGYEFLDTRLSGAAGAEYRFEAEVVGIGRAFAEQRMPTAPTVAVRSYEPDGAVDIDGFRLDELVLTLEDVPGEENFYGFRVVVTSFDFVCDQDPAGQVTCDSFPRRFDVFSSSPDPLLLETNDYGLVLRDDSFSGQDKDVRLQFSSQGDNSPLSVEVFSLTEDGYRYVTSRYAAQEAADNPFAEPVTVHENIEGGLGIFMVSNLVRLEVRR